MDQSYVNILKRPASCGAEMSSDCQLWCHHDGVLNKAKHISEISMQQEENTNISSCIKGLHKI